MKFRLVVWSQPSLQIAKNTKKVCIVSGFLHTKKYEINKRSHIFPKTCYHTQFQNLKLSVAKDAPTSEVRVFAMLVLLVVVIKNMALRTE
jgi:hypothetical protein